MSNWKSTCRTTKVDQEDAHGCGVACLAMCAKVTYAESRTTFDNLGLSLKRNNKPPYSTNFKELLAALGAQGLVASKKHWTGWDNFHGLGIIKVKCAPGAPKNRFHWVVAEQHPVHGAVIFDSDFELPCFRTAPPLGVIHNPFENYEAYGSWISIGG